ncbi:MAG: hypothetical protein KAS59_03355 [Alphaproteobacteria bacterium]|nr:hypothetical protein [Alphaproteobacteria bacterium]
MTRCVCNSNFTGMNNKTTSSTPVTRHPSLDQKRADALRKNLQKRKGQARVRGAIESSNKEK